MLDTLVAAVGPELADAVAIALALDPRDRYESAREMGRALTDGANGIAPDARRRPPDAPPTDATSVLQRDRAAAEATRQQRAAEAVVPRRPRPGPPRAAPRPEPIRAAAPRRGGAARGARRLLLAALVMLALAAVIGAVVLATASGPTRVVLRNVVYSDVEHTASALKQLVSENTK